MPILSLFPSSGTASLEQQIAAVVASMETHTSNATVHITADERSAWNAKASGTHTHGMADVTGLVTALAGKAASDHSHDGLYYTETEINDKLAKKSDTDHVHKQADVTGLVTALADKAPLSHTHDDRYYTEDEIDEKLSAIPVKMLEGTDDNPINLTTLTETGTYYISGTTTETSDEVGLLKTLKLPLYVYAAYVTSETGSTTRVMQTYIVSLDLASVSREVSPTLSAWSTQVSSQEGHDHDNRYYTEDEMDSKLAEKSDTTHTHDDRYYTETEMDTKLAEKSSAARVETLAGLVSQIGDTKKTKRTSCGDNWALCNGAVVSSTDYPDLAAMLPVDLTDWHETGALTRAPLCASEMSGKIVVGCADGYVLVYDGLTEAPTEIKLGTSPHRDIVFDGTKLVSLSGNNVWQCSGDPATVGSWSSAAIGVSEITDVFAVAHSGSTWAIYAGYTSGYTERGKVYTSSNLSTWTEQLDFAANGYRSARIICREGVFVGVRDTQYQPCCFVGDTTGAEWAKVTFEQHNNSGSSLAVTCDETYFYVRTFYYAFRATNPRGTWEMIHEGQLPTRGLLATPYGFLQADYSTASLSQTATEFGKTIKTFSNVSGNEGARFVYLPASGVYLLLVPKTGEKIYYSGNLLPLIATDEDGLDTFIRVS